MTGGGGEGPTIRIIGRLLILAAVVAALLAALDMLVIGNTQGAQLNLPGLAFRASLGFVVAAALALLASHNADQLLVVQNGEVVGLLTRDAVARLVEARRGLEPERPQRQDGEPAPARAVRPDLPASA